MSASTASTRGGFGQTAKMFFLGAIIALFGMLAIAGPAKAAPVSMDLTNGQLNLGFAFRGAEVLPAPATIGATNLPNLWNARDTVNAQNPFSALPVGCLTPGLLDITVSPPTPVGSNPLPACTGNPAAATVAGELVGNAVTITGSPQPTANGGLGPVPQPTATPVGWGLPNGFRFPIMVVPNPLDNSPVPISIATTGDLTGTFDSVSGALSLAGPIEARVLTGLSSNPLGSYCALPLTGLTLSTTSNDDFPGVPFNSADGFAGEGALTGTYNITADATSYAGADCGTVNSVSKGSGSIWVSNGIDEPPVCPDNTTGIPPACEPIPCPAGFTGNEPDCVQLAARIGTVAVSGPARVKKGASASYRVTIRNTGNTAATGVRLVASGRGIRLNSPIGTIAAGGTRTETLRVRPRVIGTVKATFRVSSANAGSRSAMKTIKVVK
ncbi:MAG: hypothetical protein WEB05_02600 [Solirubrobacterales bacterium]